MLPIVPTRIWKANVYRMSAAKGADPERIPAMDFTIPAKHVDLAMRAAAARVKRGGQLLRSVNAGADRTLRILLHPKA